MYDESLIAEVGRRLAAAAPGAQVILFGSHARGDARADSDLDVLVVERDVVDPASEEVRLRRALRGLRVFADVVVVDAADADRLRGSSSTIVGRALDEGRVLAA